MLPGMRTYGVSAAARRPLVYFMESALRDAGCRILSQSPPTVAPFVLTFETSTGERMGVVAYAFLATRTLTRNRPEDERSFQIKYGKKEKNNLHQLWLDPRRLYTTILIGIDPNEKFFVAADPRQHNPTKFFIRIEFKDEHADQIKKHGWYAWARSKRALNADPTETFVGGVKSSFLELLRFERAAEGLDPRERQRMADARKP
jgi:hypothetical protein